MKFYIGLGLLVLMAPAVMAQERAAGQANDAQVNWSILSGKLDAISHQNQLISAALTSLTGKMDAIAACGVQQKVWNGTGCVTTLAPKAETATFRVNLGGFSGGPAPTSATCRSKGYDAMTSSVAQTSEHHTGGSTGGMESYTSGYTYTCVRVVNR